MKTNSAQWVFYHKDCHDGTAAAAVAKMAIGDLATYWPVDYNDPIPAIDEGAEVTFVDFCPSLEDLSRLLRSHKVLIIDHHKTAEKRLEAFQHENLTTVFDMGKSGALLAWQYFFPDYSIPYQVMLVSDRDLFRFEFGDATRAAYCYMKTLNYNIDAVMEFIRLGGQDLKDALDAGLRMLKYHQSLVQTFASRYPDRIYLDGAYVPVFNLPREFGSDVCAAYLASHPEEVAVGYFSVADSNATFGLRSRTADECDVSEIAEAFNGGGHACASGFRISALTAQLLIAPQESK